VRLERRQPSQDFGPIIADRNVLTVLHIEMGDYVGRRASIKILGAGSIKIILI